MGPVRRGVPGRPPRGDLALNRVVHAPYYVLFLVGPAANAVEIWWTSRRTAPADKQPLAVSSVTIQRPASNRPPINLLPSLRRDKLITSLKFEKGEP